MTTWSRRRLLAEFGESALVLRPQAVHHERIGPRPALLLRWCAAFAGGFAERRGPRKREHVEVELTGVVLAPILRRRDTDIDCEPHRDRGEPHATDIANHGGHSHQGGDNAREYHSRIYPLTASTGYDTFAFNHRGQSWPNIP